jgi:hypothetical protein
MVSSRWFGPRCRVGLACCEVGNLVQGGADVVEVAPLQGIAHPLVDSELQEEQEFGLAENEIVVLQLLENVLEGGHESLVAVPSLAYVTQSSEGVSPKRV